MVDRLIQGLFGRHRAHRLVHRAGVLDRVLAALRLEQPGEAEIEDPGVTVVRDQDRLGPQRQEEDLPGMGDFILLGIFSRKNTAMRFRWPLIVNRPTDFHVVDPNGGRFVTSGKHIGQ